MEQISAWSSCILNIEPIVHFRTSFPITLAEKNRINKEKPQYHLLIDQLLDILGPNRLYLKERGNEYNHYYMIQNEDDFNDKINLLPIKNYMVYRRVPGDGNITTFTIEILSRYYLEYNLHWNNEIGIFVYDTYYNT